MTVVNLNLIFSTVKLRLQNAFKFRETECFYFKLILSFVKVNFNFVTHDSTAAKRILRFAKRKWDYVNGNC